MTNIVHYCWRRFLVAALLPLGIPFALAGSAPVLSGSYSVVQKKPVGSRVQVRMYIHLVNHGSSDLSIQRMTLWDFSHPEKGGSAACALTLRANASADMTQEFIVPRLDYQQWQKGFRPRFVLQLAAPERAAGRSTKSTAIVRLDRSSGQEGK